MGKGAQGGRFRVGDRVIVTDRERFPDLHFVCPEGEVVRVLAGSYYEGEEYVIRLRSVARLKSAVGIYLRDHQVETLHTSHPEAFRLLRRAR